MLTPEIQLVRPLGQGGMGCVWLAEHLGLGCEVAVKFLRDQIADDPSARERFRREAANAAKLDSPHVVRVLDHGHSDHDVPYIAMEVLEGETVQDRVEERGRLSFEETSRILRHACEGLMVAHDAGIVHRDIKPDNLFIVEGPRARSAGAEGDEHRSPAGMGLGSEGPDPVVKILDFGIARQMEDLQGRVTTTGNVVGTPLFMAPEQMSGIAMLPTSDLWSLGVVIYYCLTGQLPYEGASLAALALAIDREQPEPVSTFVEGLPPAFDTWLGRALAPRPEDRYPDARAMLEAFECYVARQNPPTMPSFPGSCEWASRAPATPVATRGRFPTPRRATPRRSTAVRPTVRTLAPTARFARVGVGQRASRAVFAFSVAALVASVALVGFHADRASGSPGVANAAQAATPPGTGAPMPTPAEIAVPEGTPESMPTPTAVAETQKPAPSASVSSRPSEKVRRVQVRRNLGF